MRAPSSVCRSSRTSSWAESSARTSSQSEPASGTIATSSSESIFDVKTTWERKGSRSRRAADLLDLLVALRADALAVAPVLLFELLEALRVHGLATSGLEEDLALGEPGLV